MMKKSPALPNVLIVDDASANLELLAGILRERGIEPRPVLSGKLAILAVQADPPDLILLDINMPEMNGFEVYARLKADAAFKDIPVIFITALMETADKLKAFSMGAVDYVTKPFQGEEVCARVETHLRLRKLQLDVETYNNHLEELVQEKIKEISRSQMATIFALAKLAESRDSNTGQHLERVQALSRILACELRGMPQYASIITDLYLENLCQAAPLHDIGKVGISDAIFLKPGKLSPTEFDEMKRHAMFGAETLKSVQAEYPGNSFIEMGIDIAQSHHEKFDGSGYPCGLKGAAIPLSASIVAVADVYDAMRSQRPYKSALSHAEATDFIIQSGGKHLSPDIVAAFARRAGDFEALYPSAYAPVSGQESFRERGVSPSRERGERGVSPSNNVGKEGERGVSPSNNE
jgi:putative two-component system response regulator